MTPQLSATPLPDDTAGPLPPEPHDSPPEQASPDKAATLAPPPSDDTTSPPQPVCLHVQWLGDLAHVIIEVSSGPPISQVLRADTSGDWAQELVILREVLVSQWPSLVVLQPADTPVPAPPASAPITPPAPARPTSRKATKAATTAPSPTPAAPVGPRPTPVLPPMPKDFAQATLFE